MRVGSFTLSRLQKYARGETMPEVILTQEEAARQLVQEPLTLAKWRCRGRGPAYLKIGGKVCYRQSDIDAFIAASRRVPGEGKRACAAAQRDFSPQTETSGPFVGVARHDALGPEAAFLCENSSVRLVTRNGKGRPAKGGQSNFPLRKVVHNAKPKTKQPASVSRRPKCNRRGQRRAI